MSFDQSLGTLSYLNAWLIILNSKSMQRSLRRTSTGLPAIPNAFRNFASYTDFRTSLYVISLFNEEQSAFGNKGPSGLCKFSFTRCKCSESNEVSVSLLR